MNHKAVRKSVGAVLVLVLLISFTKMDAITNTIEAHPWVGVALLVFALAYVLWGCFGINGIWVVDFCWVLLVFSGFFWWWKLGISNGRRVGNEASEKHLQ